MVAKKAADSSVQGVTWVRTFWWFYKFWVFREEKGFLKEVLAEKNFSFLQAVAKERPHRVL